MKHENKFIDRTGEKHTTSEGYEITIIEYYRNDNCTILFQDGCVLTEKSYQHIRKGKIKNPYHPSVYGVGFFGEGVYKSINNSTYTKHYIIWKDMLGRSYDEKKRKKHPSYKNCTVDPRWHNFQIFAAWFEENYIEGFCLDKDILIKGNKVYSPETCCFVPYALNNLIKTGNNIYKSLNGRFKVQLSIRGNTCYLGCFSNKKEALQVFKRAKEAYIKELTNEWKNLITEQVYGALINYQVEIND